MHTRWNSGYGLVQLQFIENRYMVPVNDDQRTRRQRTTHWSFQRHRDPTSTTASLYCQKSCLEHENAPTRINMRPKILTSERPILTQRL